MQDLYHTGYLDMVETIDKNTGPTLEHIVDLMSLAPEQLYQINETARLAQYRHKVFQVIGNIFHELNKLGSWDQDLFAKDKRIGPAVKMYQKWAYSQLKEIELEEEHVQFSVAAPICSDYKIARFYENLFGPHLNIHVSASESRVCFSVCDWKVELPAAVSKTGEHSVPSHFYPILLSHLKESRSAEVELIPMRYQVNNTVIYPPRPKNCFDEYEQYLSDVRNYNNSLSKHGVSAQQPKSPADWLRSAR